MKSESKKKLGVALLLLGAIALLLIYRSADVEHDATTAVERQDEEGQEPNPASQIPPPIFVPAPGQISGRESRNNLYH